MPVKISGTRKLSKRLVKLVPDARSYFAKEMKRTIVDILVEKITSGLSPVKGYNRYKKYSEGYGKYKGRKQPVDLVDSGDMLNAMIAKKTNDNNIIVEFKGKYANTVASAHQNGKGKMPQRKIFPTGREIFKAEIMDKIIAAVKLAIKKAIK